MACGYVFAWSTIPYVLTGRLCGKVQGMQSEEYVWPDMRTVHRCTSTVELRVCTCKWVKQDIRHVSLYAHPFCNTAIKQRGGKDMGTLTFTRIPPYPYAHVYTISAESPSLPLLFQSSPPLPFFLGVCCYYQRRSNMPNAHSCRCMLTVYSLLAK